MVDPLCGTALDKGREPAEATPSGDHKIRTDVIRMGQNFGGRIAMWHMGLDRIHSHFSGNRLRFIQYLLPGLFDLLDARPGNRGMIPRNRPDDEGRRFGVRNMHQRHRRRIVLRKITGDPRGGLGRFRAV